MVLWQFSELIPIFASYVLSNSTINVSVITRKDKRRKVNMNKSDYQHQYSSSLRSHNMKKKTKHKIFWDVEWSQIWTISDILNLE